MKFIAAKDSDHSLLTHPQDAPLQTAQSEVEPAPAPLTVPSKASAGAAAKAMGHYADSSSLSDEEIKKAVAWSRHQHFSKEKLTALQTAVGASPAGHYDAATAQAVAAAQRLHGLHADGQAGHTTRQTLGLEGSSVVQASSKEKGKAPAHELSQGGVSVALFNQFDTKKTGKGDLEFERRADDYAKQYQAVGLRDGALAWNRSTPFKGLPSMSSAIQGIHTALVEYVDSNKKGAAKPTSSKESSVAIVPAQPTGAAHEPASSNDAGKVEVSATPAALADQEEAEQPDHSTQIKHLAIFTHGMEYGIDTNPNKHTYVDGLHKDHNRLESNIPAFVSGISDALTPDVSVQLYACSTGREEGQGQGSKEGQELDMPVAGERRGSDSFGAHMAEALQEQGHKEASVFSHINAKHTTENPYARVFGYEAGAETGGEPMFDMLYPSEFTNGELLKIVPDLFTRPPEEQEQLHSRMRVLMWEHYVDSVRGEHRRRDHGGEMVFGRRTYTGMEMFQDPEGTAAKLQADFKTRWLTDKKAGDILRHVLATKGRGFKD